MSEITKLYENAGVNQVCNTCELRGFKRLCPTKELCVRTNPPFTAEKQLELIKWCLDNYRGYIFDSIETEWFEEQLCAFINNIWQDLTEEERKQIADILKG